MDRTLVGIDVKILPEELRTGDNVWDKAKVIEGNGNNTGLSVLTDNGVDKMGALVDELGLDKNKIFLVYHVDRSDSDLGTTDLVGFANDVDSFEGVRYPFSQVTEWVHDLPSYYVDQRKKLFDGVGRRVDNNTRSLVEKAREKGIKVIVASTWQFGAYGILVCQAPASPAVNILKEKTAKNRDPEGRFIPWEDISLFRGVRNGLFERIMGERKDTYFNSRFSEEVFDNKGILFGLDELFPDLGINLRKYQPKSTVWGCGLTNVEEARAWFRATAAARYVRKPLEGSQGRGIRFFEEREFLEGRESHLDRPEDVEAAYLNLSIDVAMSGADIAKRAVLIQEFVPSVPILHDGKLYDGCARVVLANGTYIKGQWRVGRAPLDSLESDDRKLRANTSVGSSVVEMSAEHEDIAADISERFTRDFFHATAAIEDRLGQADLDLFSNKELFHPSSVLPALFYLQRLKRSAVGYLDLKESLQRNLPKELAGALTQAYDFV